MSRETSITVSLPVLRRFTGRPRSPTGRIPSIGARSHGPKQNTRTTGFGSTIHEEQVTILKRACHQAPTIRKRGGALRPTKLLESGEVKSLRELARKESTAATEPDGQLDHLGPRYRGGDSR